ncbi:M43 family zinc metalloprotease [Spirosoma validum]|uniref:T9SS type A sorting domain-containing protein n=1 Tax=Spirosoma validum TaxID=2771355 RepID=A0A927B1V0_9BACT|nr:M43 family zinc metalloprotease [Spirosoma validum]MBD2754040.1 T9SS type A sorting domain-containing protein [Spirosoma validum]
MTKLVSSNRMLVKRIGWSWLAGSFCCLLISSANAQTIDETALNRCGTVERERILQQRNPNRLRQVNELNRRIEQLQSQSKTLRQQADEKIYRIPVVVHVVHSTASGQIGGANNINISDEQINSQIQVLNEDYRRKEGTNGYNTSSIGADAGIEFYLATTDPNGQPTNGITRHYYAQKGSFDVFSDDLLLSQIAYWPSDRYLNIWVTRVNQYLGFTQFPTTADTLKGLPSDVNELTDGSIIDYRYFGRQTGTVTNNTYALGRTATHEIGHWLGLIHTWGDGDGCAEDYVADTPLTKAANQTTQCRQTYSTCVAGKQTRDLTEDFMDYSPDACMNLFTAGQVARMRAVLALSPRRVKLINSSAGPLAETEKLTINLYPNPTTTAPSIDVQLKGSQSFTVDLFDATGRQLRTTTYANSPSSRISLPVTGLATGIYIVRVKTDGETASKRLLLQ